MAPSSRTSRTHFSTVTVRKAGFNFNGQYTQNPLSAGNTGDAFADFLLGYPQTMQRSYPAEYLRRAAGSSWSFYGQDDYRVSRNLTLNLGMRWELMSWMAGVRGQTNAFDFATGKVIIPTKNGTPDMTAQPGIPLNWSVFRSLLETTEEKGLPWSIRPRDNLCPAPRIGFAWRAFGSDKWVVRSAYGIFCLYPDTNLLQPLYRTPPFNVIQLVNNDVPTATTLTPTRTLANYWLGQPLASLNTTPAITTMGTFYRSAYQQTWNLNLQHEFANGVAAEVAYVGKQGDPASIRVGRKRPAGRARQRAGAQALSELGSFPSPAMGWVEHLPQPPDEG